MGDPPPLEDARNRRNVWTKAVDLELLICVANIRDVGWQWRDFFIPI